MMEAIRPSGSRVTDPATGEVVDLKDGRIKAAVMFSPPGDGKDMAPWAAQNFPAIGANDFGHMTLPPLVVTGTKDFAPVFSERQDWRADAYRLIPAPKALLTLEDAGHLVRRHLRLGRQGNERREPRPRRSGAADQLGIPSLDAVPRRRCMERHHA